MEEVKMTSKISIQMKATAMFASFWENRRQKQEFVRAKQIAQIHVHKKN